MRNSSHPADSMIHSAAPAVFLALLTFPYEALAQTVASAVSVFNIFVGLMLVAAFLTYGVGFVTWVTRLGTWPSNRTEGVKILEWAVAILFVLVVILMIVQFFRDHTTAATYTVAAIVLVLLAWAVLAMLKHSAKKEEE